MDRSLQEFPIVGVGASAGGLEAFTQLLGAVPQHTGMGFVLVQHLAPHHKSGLVTLLSRITQLPVREITDGVVVRPDTIYVNPANAEVTIEGGALHLHPRIAEQPSLPINRFLISLAEDQQDCAIGIVLSGAASDGTLGLTAIHTAGGTTFAQDSTASVPGMPDSAIRAEVVDFVLPPDEIPPVLVRLSDESAADNKKAGQREGSAFDAILALVGERVGVSMTPYKTPTLSRRIHRRMLLHNLDSLVRYVGYLKKNPAEVDALYADMLINVTHMFRDPPTLDLLKRKVLPALAAKRTAEKPIRIWVAGCASGEEAYTLAIMCREFMNSWSLNIPVQIFATDLSGPMIARARAGLYSAAALEGVSEGQLKKFFVPEGEQYRAGQSIRQMCIFAEHNLLADPPFSQMDIISCCNVLIYFQPASQQKVMNIFHYALRPGGFLVLGSSETVGSSRTLFSLFDPNRKVYTRKVAMTPSYFTSDNRPPKHSAGANTPARTRERTDDGSDIGQLADNLLLARYTPGSIVVDNDMEIVQFRGTTSAYLEPNPGKASLNIFKMARPGLAGPLRKAIREVKKSKQPYQCTATVKHEKNPQDITLDVLPIVTGATEPYFLIVFTTSLNSGPSLDIQPKPSKFNAKDRQIMQLDVELTEAQDEMRRLSEDHDVTVQELQLSNEEIRSANEELQTLNEELETSGEELASSNEELLTMNQSLRDSNEQLKVSRDFAEGIIRTVRESLLVLDRQLRVRTASDSFYQTFRSKPEMTEGKYIYELGDGQWRIPELQTLLEDILPQNSYLQDYVVRHDFPGIGPKVMQLNARRVATRGEGNEHMVLLAIEDITDRAQPPQ